MQGFGGTVQDQDVDFSAFLDDAAFDGDSPAAHPLVRPPADALAAKGRAGQLQGAQAGTPTASTSSGNSPGVSDSTSSPSAAPPETALTSASTSPRLAQFAHLAAMNPGGKLPDGLEQLAANWQAHQRAAREAEAAFQQAAAAAAAAAGYPLAGVQGAQGLAAFSAHLGALSYPQAIAPINPVSTSASFPTQLPHDWLFAAAQSAAPAYSGTTTPVSHPSLPLGPSPFVPAAAASQSARPSLNHLGQVASPNGAVDPSLYALHASLEAQARMAAAAAVGQAGSAPGTPSGFDLAFFQQQQQQAGPSSSTASSPRAHSRAASGQGHRPMSGLAKSALGSSAGGSGRPGAVPPRVRTDSSQYSSPLASPAILSGIDFASLPSTAYGSPAGYSATPTTTTHQRPLPPMPPALLDTSSTASPYSSVPSSAAISPSISQSPAFPSSRLASSSILPNGSTIAFSQPQSPRSAQQSRHVPVDFDFSSLEQDLDRFSSLGGFASAAAAAIASVSPSSSVSALPGPSALSQQLKPSGSLQYGGSSTPRLAPESLASPKVVAEVLGESLYFPPPPLPGSNKASPVASGSAGGSIGTGSAGASPAAFSTGAGSGAGAAVGKGVSFAPSPAEAASPSGSTIIDEDSAELLSRKDPIAAQVWRMFHKAKNTMPNGARMENLTWRLMSMTLRKRREEGAGADGAAGTVSQAPSPGTEEARLRKAVEEALEEQREEVDTVQPLASSSGRMRSGRDRSDSGAKRATAPPTRAEEPADDEEERGRGRRTKTGNQQSKSKSSTPEAEEQQECVSLTLPLTVPKLTFVG